MDSPSSKEGRPPREHFQRKRHRGQRCQALFPAWGFPGGSPAAGVRIQRASPKERSVWSSLFRGTMCAPRGKHAFKHKFSHPACFPFSARTRDRQATEGSLRNFSDRPSVSGSRKKHEEMTLLSKYIKYSNPIEVLARDQRSLVIVPPKVKNHHVKRNTPFNGRE